MYNYTIFNIDHTLKRNSDGIFTRPSSLNYSPPTKLSIPLDTVNKVLLEHSQVH
jgi:hypothetical protein